jgi:23S rRNA (cytidine2498-2'-O)-methyltransferase
MSGAFVFAICQVGAERALKAEVGARLPRCHPAYARPGLVTFKVEGTPPGPDFHLHAVFARVWGLSLGRATEPAAALAAAAPLVTSEKRTTRLHVFARDPAAPDAAAQVAVTQDALRAAARSDGVRFSDELRAADGDLVVDVVVGDDAWVIGAHVHHAGRSPLPGGVLPVDIPAEAPSRAYAKIEEAIAWAGLPMHAGEVALEIGSSPGGAALALARRGLEVWGVDTGTMDPGVLAFRHPSGARVHHLATKVGGLRWEELPPRVDWLLVDVNLAPQVALHSVQRLMPPLGKTLKGAVFTLKLNDWAMADQLPALLERVKSLGFSTVSATHLPSNRQEVCAIARR